MFLTSSKISKDGLKCFSRIFLAVLQKMVLHLLLEIVKGEKYETFCVFKLLIW